MSSLGQPWCWWGKNLRSSVTCFSQFLWGILPRSVNHSLNPAFMLQPPALVARRWKHKLGGAGGRVNLPVSGESHWKPVKRLCVTTAFVVPCLQAETAGNTEQTEELKAVVLAESVWKKPGLGEVAVTGMSVRNLKQQLFPALYGAGLSLSLCLSFPVCTPLARWLISSRSSSLSAVARPFDQLLPCEARCSSRTVTSLKCWYWDLGIHWGRMKIVLYVCMD